MEFFSFSPRPDYVVTGPPRSQSSFSTPIQIVERGYFGEPIPTTYHRVSAPQPMFYPEPVIHTQTIIHPPVPVLGMFHGQGPTMYMHERRVHVISSPQSNQSNFEQSIRQHQNSTRTNGCDCRGRCHGHGPTFSF